MTFLEKFSRRLGVLEYLGTWDASTGNPPATAQRGGYYIVSVAGTTNLDGENDWNPGDWAIYSGTAWQKIDSTDQVESVAGKQGAVTLQAADITDFSAAVQSEIFPDLVQTGVRYVSPSGNDLSASGGLAAPFQTIAAALVGAPSGTVIFLLPGVYSEPTPTIPSQITIRGLGNGTTEIVNGLTHTSGSGDAVDIRLQAINFNGLTLDETDALNGLISIKESVGSITRTDSNANVLIQMTESTLVGASIAGASSTFNECLVISSPTFTGGSAIFENSKFVARIEAEGSATVSTLDCVLFGATEFVNGTIASAQTPTWLTDLATEALGGYTGDITKQVLADLQSTDLSDFESAVTAVVEPVYQATKEPTGHSDRTQSTVSFDELTRTFSIAPVLTTFDIYISGVKQTISSTLSVQIPNTSGNFFFYIDQNGALQYQQAFDITLFTAKVYTGYVYWNAEDEKVTAWGEERHGLTMDSATHSYLHTTRGLQLVSGLSVSYALGDGSLDADAQVAFTDCQVRDEDITIQVTNSATPSAPFQQKLSPIGFIPILYREGSVWKKSVATKFPVLTGPNRTYYNEFTGGSWQLTEAPSNNKVCVTYIFATTDIQNPIIGILGQAEYQNIDEARELAAWDQISFGDLPAQELKLCFVVYYETSSGYLNESKAKIVFVGDTRFNTDRQVSATAFNGDHSNLSGLSNDDHLQYLPLSGARSMTGDLDLGSNDLVNVASLNGVSSAEIGYLDGVTSSIQTQIDAKLDDSQLGAANGVASLDALTRLPSSQLTILSLQAGAVASGSFAGNPKKATVTLPATMPSTNYSVAITGSTDARAWTVESKTTTSFVISSNSNQSLTGSVDWLALNQGAL